MADKKIPVVDYCKEALDLHLAKLSERDIDLITINLAKMIYGSKNDVDIFMGRKDDKTGEVRNVRVPAKSFLRTDIIRKELKSIGIGTARIDKYLNNN